MFFVKIVILLECGRTYQENAATFSSPSYLSKIGPEEGERCEWRITATHGEKIVLNITELDIAKSPDCKTDFIEIRDGYWQKSELLGRFCGTGKIDSIISIGSRMLVTYVARYPSGHRGFMANYEGKNVVLRYIFSAVLTLLHNIVFRSTIRTNKNFMKKEQKQ